MILQFERHPYRVFLTAFKAYGLVPIRAMGCWRYYSNPLLVKCDEERMVEPSPVQMWNGKAWRAV